MSPDRWILGRGYDDTGLRDMRHPTRRDLDQASAEHPIVIWHNSGHPAVHQIGKIPVAATMVGGEVAYQEAAIG